MSVSVAIDGTPQVGARIHDDAPTLRPTPQPTPRPPITGNVMTDSNIKAAVAAWLSDATAAEATYGHISTWETGG